MKINGKSFKFKTFHFYSDPGHGWMKVPYEAINRLGIGHKISSFSYERGCSVYLEEDRDALYFLNALRENGIDNYKLIQHNTDRMSKIRSYASYNPKNHND